MKEKANISFTNHQIPRTKISSTLLRKGGGYHLSYVLLLLNSVVKKSKKKGRQSFSGKYKINLELRNVKFLVIGTLGFVELIFAFPFSRCMFYNQILMGSGMLMLHLLFLHHGIKPKEGLIIPGASIDVVGII